MTAVYGLKFVLVGDSEAGKSQLLRKFTNKSFNADSKTTTGMEFGSREFPFERCTIKAQVWDTAGKERPPKMTKAFYRDSLGAFVVFDICNAKSFNRLKTYWMPEIRTYGHENMPCILVGNKVDLAANREVSVSEAKLLAKEFKMDYVETSAATGAGAEVAFRRLAILVARMLPTVKTHLEMTNLPDGWICISPRTLSIGEGSNLSASPSFTSPTGSISNSANSYNTNNSIRSNLHPQSISSQRRDPSDISIVAEPLSSSFAALPGISGDSIPAGVGIGVDVYVNYWTGQEQTIRPTAQVDPPLIYDAVQDERQSEMEARASLQASALASRLAQADNSSSSVNETTRSTSRTAIDIQQRDSVQVSGERKVSSSSSDCFCVLM